MAPFKTWHVNEIPCRAPPLPEDCLFATLGWCLFHKEYAFGLTLVLGFYGLLRTGELLGLCNNHILMTAPGRPAVISLGLTKGGKRAGSSESVTISVQCALQWLWAWKTSVHFNGFGPGKPRLLHTVHWHQNPTSGVGCSATVSNP